MLQTSHYEFPLGDVFLAADDKGLAGLWFEGQRYYPEDLERLHDDTNTHGLGVGVKEDPFPYSTTSEDGSTYTLRGENRDS